MKIRQTVKKAVALGTGALMLGATILGASAANLSDYPTVFVKDGKLTGTKIVVGAGAQPIDIVGAIDIAADLQAHAVTQTAVTTSGTGISVSGGKTHEIALGSTLASEFSLLKNAQIPSLVDEKISWNDHDIAVKESIDVSKMKIMTSADDKQFGASPVLGNNAPDAVEYLYTVGPDTNFNMSQVDANNNPLKITVLGKDVEIQSIGTNSVTMSVANEYYLNVGDSVTVDGHKITLKRAGTDAVVVDVDGVVDTVSGLNTSKKVNGENIQIVSSFSTTDPTQGSASLKIGNKITETVNNGDPMTLFGEPDSTIDANWVWHVDTATANELVIGADFNQILNSVSQPVKKIGDKLTLPNNYASLYMDSLTVPAASDKLDFAFKQGVRINKYENDSDVANSVLNNMNALMITAPKNDMLKVNVAGTSTDTDVVYLIPNTEGNETHMIGAYQTSDNNVKLFTRDTFANDANATAEAALNYVTVSDDQTTFAITYSGFATAPNTAAENENITIGASVTPAVTDDLNLGNNATITLVASINNKYFGADDTGYVAGDFLTSADFVVDKDYDYLTNYGVVIAAPKAQLDSEKFELVLPTDQVKVNTVVVGSSGSAVSAAGGSVTTETVNPVGVDFAVLDTDYTMGSANSIVVGGPCVNTVAAKLLGNPADCTAGFAQGEAKLTMFPDGSKVALLVAGYTGADTLSATRALITGTLPAKSSATVVTTNIKNPTIE